MVLNANGIWMFLVAVVGLVKCPAMTFSGRCNHSEQITAAAVAAGL
jgi:hypothetical protein